MHKGLREAYVIDKQPYFEPFVVISEWSSKSVMYHSPFSAKDHRTGELVQAKTLESLYRKLAYRAKKDS